ncbi:MAG: hypothetical protein Q9218_003083, partial [Villophora microphyllina]
MDDCANPLWLGWMEEWLEMARERNLKTTTMSLTKSSYKKAINSLKSCPLSLTHPSEAQALNGFGPKICGDLEKRLQRHCEENRLPMPKRKSRKRTSDALEEAALDMTPAKKPKKSKKPYVPQLRSGAYAIVLGLSSVGEDECVSKQQLIGLAQPHCDASFDNPKDTTSFYTAWASMKTLTDKDLVKETSRPQRRYCLTDEGWEVAERIKRTNKGDGEGSDNRRNAGQPEGRTPWEAATFPSFKVPGLLIDADNDLGLLRRSANIQERPPLEDRSNSNIVSVPNMTGQCLGGAVADKFGTAASFRDRKKAGTLGRTSSLPTPRSGALEVNVQDDAALAARLQAEENERARQADQDVDFVELLSSPPPQILPPTRARERSLPTRTDRPSILRESEPPLQQAPTKTTSSAFTPPVFQPIHIPPGSFTIKLILDNREIRSREDRNYIEKALITQSIRPIVRSLPLGDFFWVAKLHPSHTHLLSRAGEEGDEIALDYIVERKRTDDLISSIKDGRFREQKWRLGRSGVKNVTYLVEEIGISAEMRDRYGEAVQSAIASTQVVNGFFVKRTKGLDDTIRYLTRMTRVLKGVYENKPLTLLPSHTLSPQTYLPLLSHLASHQSPDQAKVNYNITFPSFASLASKSDNRTLRDVFLQMLMTTKGLTADKAIAVQKIYPTPRQFIEAYRSCLDDKEKEGMVERKLVEKGVMGREKVGRQLSKVLAEVWRGG